MFRSTWRHTQPICKVDFTKYRYLTLFLKNIWLYKKNIVLLHREFKNEVKKIFNILAIRFDSQITFIYKQQNYDIMESFIKSIELSSLKFFGIKIRIDSVLIEEKPTIYIITKRTCSKNDEETWTFSDINDAIRKYKNIIKNIKTSWGSEIANLIHE